MPATLLFASAGACAVGVIALFLAANLGRRGVAAIGLLGFGFGFILGVWSGRFGRGLGWGLLIGVPCAASYWLDKSRNGPSKVELTEGADRLVLVCGIGVVASYVILALTEILGEESDRLLSALGALGVISSVLLTVIAISAATQHRKEHGDRSE